VKVAANYIQATTTNFRSFSFFTGVPFDRLGKRKKEFVLYESNFTANALVESTTEGLVANKLLPLISLSPDASGKMMKITTCEMPLVLIPLQTVSK
jgi:hypothetical protein